MFCFYVMLSSVSFVCHELHLFVNICMQTTFALA